MKKIFAWTVILALFALTACDGKKTHALIKAVEKNNVAEARRLIVAGADMNATDNDGKPAYDECYGYFPLLSLGGAALAVLLVVILLAVRKRKSNKD